MSYSLQFSAKSREEARAMLAAELDRVSEQQPVHRNDREKAQHAAEDMLALLPDPAEGEVFNVHMVGSLTWRGDPGSNDIVGASVAVAVTLGQPTRWQDGQRRA